MFKDNIYFLRAFRIKVATYIMYAALLSISAPIIYYIKGIPIYESPGLYLPFFALILLYLTRFPKYHQWIIYAILLLSFLSLVALYLLSSFENEKMLFFPMFVFAFYALVEYRIATILTFGLIVFIVVAGFALDIYDEMGLYNFYALLLSLVSVMIAFHFTSRMMSQLDHQSKLLLENAYLDKLTLLHNRADFDYTLSKMLEQKTYFSLLMIDLDNFKSVNDIYGHAKGDEVLQETAQFLKDNTRYNDLLFRWGGDEFFLVLVGESAKKDRDIAEKLRKKFNQSTLYTTYKMTLSIGLSQLNYEDTIQSIVARADQALYDAKEHGKNQVSIH